MADQAPLSQLASTFAFKADKATNNLVGMDTNEKLLPEYLIAFNTENDKFSQEIDLKNSENDLIG